MPSKERQTLNMTSSTNNAGLDLCSVKPLWSTVLLFLGVFIFLGSAVTVAVFRRRRFVLKRASYLLINLAIADLLVGVGVVGFAISGLAYYHSLSAHFCMALSTFISFSVVASIGSLTVIAMERAFAIAYPLRHRTSPTTYFHAANCLAWALATIVTVFSGLYMAGFYVTRFVVGSICVACLMTIFFSYFVVWRVSSKRLSIKPVHGQSHEQNRRLANTLFIVTFLSLATWLPQMRMFGNFDYSVSLDTQFALVCLQFFNSLVNPFVYVLRMPGFRQEIKVLCRSRGQPGREETIPMADVGNPGGTKVCGKSRETRVHARHCTAACALEDQQKTFSAVNLYN